MRVARGDDRPDQRHCAPVDAEPGERTDERGSTQAGLLGHSAFTLAIDKGAKRGPQVVGEGNAPTRGQGWGGS